MVQENTILMANFLLNGNHKNTNDNDNEHNEKENNQTQINILRIHYSRINLFINGFGAQQSNALIGLLLLATGS